MRDEPAIVRAVLGTLTRIVAADDACLTVRSHDPLWRRLTLVLSRDHVGCGPDAALIREFVIEVLCCHGIRLDELRVESEVRVLADVDLGERGGGGR